MLLIFYLFKQHHEAELLLYENYSHSSSTLSSQNNKIYSKKYEKEIVYVCNHEIIRVIMMKMKMKMKNGSHRYDKIRPKSRHGHKYSKYKKCLNMMMLLCIKQHLRNIWSSIHEKVKQHWDWVDKKSIAYKKACISTISSI